MTSTALTYRQPWRLLWTSDDQIWGDLASSVMKEKTKRVVRREARALEATTAVGGF